MASRGDSLQLLMAAYHSAVYGVFTPRWPSVGLKGGFFGRPLVRVCSKTVNVEKQPRCHVGLRPIRNQLLSRFSNCARYSKINLDLIWQLALKAWGSKRSDFALVVDPIHSRLHKIVHKTGDALDLFRRSVRRGIGHRCALSEGRLHGGAGVKPALAGVGKISALRSDPQTGGCPWVANEPY